MTVEGIKGGQRLLTQHHKMQEVGYEKDQDTGSERDSGYFAR